MDIRQINFDFKKDIGLSIIPGVMCMFQASGLFDEISTNFFGSFIVYATIIILAYRYARKYGLLTPLLLPLFGALLWETNEAARFLFTAVNLYRYIPYIQRVFGAIFFVVSILLIISHRKYFTLNNPVKTLRVFFLLLFATLLAGYLGNISFFSFFDVVLFNWLPWVFPFLVFGAFLSRKQKNSAVLLIFILQPMWTEIFLPLKPFSLQGFDDFSFQLRTLLLTYRLLPLLFFLVLIPIFILLYEDLTVISSWVFFLSFFSITLTTLARAILHQSLDGNYFISNWLLQGYFLLLLWLPLIFGKILFIDPPQINPES